MVESCFIWRSGFKKWKRSINYVQTVQNCVLKVQYCRGGGLLLTSSSTVKGCISPFWNPPNFPSAKSLLPAAKIMVFSGLLWYTLCCESATAGELAAWWVVAYRPCVLPNCFSRVERRAAFWGRDMAQRMDKEACGKAFGPRCVQ